MRRGTVSNASFVLIILVAFFSLISYFCDQLVIRNEDKIRNLNIDYNNAKTELFEDIFIRESLDKIYLNGITTVEGYLVKRNIWIKGLISEEHQKQSSDYFSKDKVNYINFLKDNLLEDFRNIIVDTNLFEIRYKNIFESMDESKAPFAAYMLPETSGEFGGIGIEFKMEDGIGKVISPLDNSPASRAGIKAGDYIVKVNNIQIQGKSITEVGALIRGPVGSEIEITVRRKSVEKALTFKMIREKFNVDAASNSAWTPNPTTRELTRDELNKKFKSYDPSDYFNISEIIEKNKDNFFYKDQDLYKKIYLKELTKEEIVNSFNIKNWFDVYKSTILLVENLYNFNNYSVKYISYFDKLKKKDTKNIGKIAKQLKNTTVNKNYLILFSISFQIIALFFLLLLFKNIMLMKFSLQPKKNKINNN